MLLEPPVGNTLGIVSSKGLVGILTRVLLGSAGTLTGVSLGSVGRLTEGLLASTVGALIVELSKWVSKGFCLVRSDARAQELSGGVVLEPWSTTSNLGSGKTKSLPSAVKQPFPILAVNICRQEKKVSARDTLVIKTTTQFIYISLTLILLNQLYNNIASSASKVLLSSINSSTGSPLGRQLPT